LCPVFVSYTGAFALQLRKKHEKTSVRVVEKCQFGTIQCVRMSALQVARQVVDPDFPALGDPGQRFVSVDVCRAAQLRGSLHQLTSSRITQS